MTTHCWHLRRKDDIQGKTLYQMFGEIYVDFNFINS